MTRKFVLETDGTRMQITAILVSTFVKAVRPDTEFTAIISVYDKQKHVADINIAIRYHRYGYNCEYRHIDKMVVGTHAYISYGRTKGLFTVPEIDIIGQLGADT